MKIHYSHSYYPYSKRATNLSRQAKLSWMIAMITLLISVPMLMAKVLWDEDMFIHPLILMVLSFGYIIIDAAVIQRKIDKIAHDDYMAEMIRRMNEEK